MGNRYGWMAQDHWRKYLPAAYASIEDPDKFFHDLGEEAHDQAWNLQEDMCGPDRVGEPFMEKVARYEQAQQMAEEIVTREMLLLPAEQTVADTEPTTDGDEKSVDDEIREAIEEFNRLRDQFYEEKDE